MPLAALSPQHLRMRIEGRVATLTLDRPERKNPLTFESYGELVEIFRAAAADGDVAAFVLTGAEGNFCSGGDVHDIIGRLVGMDTVGLMRFTAMTGEVVKAMRACPQPIIAAVDGVAAGAGAILAMASDIRLGTPRAKVAFLFNRVGLAGCDMGACAILPRIIGQGRASEGLSWGFYSRVVAPEELHGQAASLAAEIASGPTFAHAMTKRMLAMEWAMSIEQAIEAEAVAQALCMTTQDFRRAHAAFVAKQRPVFQGN
jgi:enoyl-CoA hydratase/carnithine racemase